MIDQNKYMDAKTNFFTHIYYGVGDKVIVLMTILSFLFLAPMAHDSDEKSQGYVLSVKVQNKSLSQALQLIADQVNIDISLEGQPPRNTESITLENTPLAQAIDRVMQTYGVSNHATLYDLDQKVVFLSILESSQTFTISTLHNSYTWPSKSSDTPLTENQISILQKKNAIELQTETENKGLLTAIQRNQLEAKENVQINELHQKKQSLGADQINELRTKTGINDTQLLLTRTQILDTVQKDVLREKQRKLKLEEQNGSALTQEQIKRLQDLNLENDVIL